MGDLEKFKQFVSSDMQYWIDNWYNSDDILDDFCDSFENKQYITWLGIWFAFRIWNKKIINRIKKINQTMSLYDEIQKNVQQGKIW